MRKSQNNVITNIKMIEIIEVSLEALMHVDSPDGALTLLTALEVEAQEYLCSNDAFDQLTTWRHECTMLCQAHEDSSYADMKLIHMLQEKNEFLQLWMHLFFYVSLCTEFSFVQFCLLIGKSRVY